MTDRRFLLFVVLALLLFAGWAYGRTRIAKEYIAACAKVGGEAVPNGAHWECLR